MSDKSQVRANGPINQLTRQPLKGRKRHGGIRFGEMERDSIIAHGASFLLHERLLNSSDRHLAVICDKCGSMLSATAKPMTQQEAATLSSDEHDVPFGAHAVCDAVSGERARGDEY